MTKADDDWFRAEMARVCTVCGCNAFRSNERNAMKGGEVQVYWTCLRCDVEASPESPDIETIAAEVLKCAVAHEPNVLLMGNVRADDIAKLAAFVAERRSSKDSPDPFALSVVPMIDSVRAEQWLNDSMDEEAIGHVHMARAVPALAKLLASVRATGSAQPDVWPSYRTMARKLREYAEDAATFGALRAQMLTNAAEVFDEEARHQEEYSCQQTRSPEPSSSSSSSGSSSPGASSPSAATRAPGVLLTNEQILAMDPRAQAMLLGAVFTEVPAASPCAGPADPMPKVMLNDAGGLGGHLAACTCDVCTMLRRDRDTPNASKAHEPRFTFHYGITEGKLEYDSDSEEWTFNGSVEGRMAAPLANIVRRYVSLGLDAEQLHHEASPSSCAADDTERAKAFWKSWYTGDITTDISTKNDHEELAVVFAALRREVLASVADMLDDRAGGLDECASWKEARDISKELRRQAARLRAGQFTSATTKEKK